MKTHIKFWLLVLFLIYILTSHYSIAVFNTFTICLYILYAIINFMAIIFWIVNGDVNSIPKFIIVKYLIIIPIDKFNNWINNLNL